MAAISAKFSSKKGGSSCAQRRTNSTFVAFTRERRDDKKMVPSQYYGQMHSSVTRT
jgi:hypothetical protein